MNDVGNDDSDAAQNDEIRAINESLVITSVRHQEYTEAARAAEQRAEAALLRLVESHKDLTNAHARLRDAHALVQASYERERLITEALQRPLTLGINEDAFPGLSVATLYEAALAEAEVGGDFFDVFALPRGQVAIAISDASGKGLSAAVRTIQVKDVLRAFTREYPYSPAAIVARLNDFVCDNQYFDQDKKVDVSFSCLTLAIIEPESGHGSLVTAGMEPALLIRADGTAEALGRGNIPLGLERQVIYAVESFDLASGDTLILVTDGITEARHEKEFLDFDGMAELAKEALVIGSLNQEPPSLRDAAAMILEGARSFSGGGPLHDDACVVLVRRH